VGLRGLLVFAPLSLIGSLGFFQVDVAVCAHKYVCMRTTIELPEDLFRMAKQTALARDCTLKELFTDALVHELKGHRVHEKLARRPLPAIRVAVDAPILTFLASQLAEADMDEEAARHDVKPD
jgi:hypothetical protein